jgi:hypothetical protein
MWKSLACSVATRNSMASATASAPLPPFASQ